MIFEAPAQVGCVLYLTVISERYPPLLEAAGALIRYIKDNNIILLPDYTWHGENEGKIVLEPVIRDLEAHKEPQFYNNMPCITLKYRMEMGINSQKGAPFKRVKERTITGNIIDT